jgi:hypothetical protein
MLGAYYRFRVVNSTDQTLTYDNGARITVKITPWKIGSSGMEQGSAISDTTSILNSGESIAAAAEAEGDVHDNTTLLHIGFSGVFEVTADQNSTDGTVDLYMEQSPDNTIWPSDQADFDCDEDLILLARLNLSTDAEDEDRSVNISF